MTAMTAKTAKPWFEVDRQGLADLLERHGGVARVVAELISNAWDEPGVTEVTVEVEPVPGTPRATVRVVDDAPDGFADLRDAFTLFAPSKKRADPEMRGRFNLGEKLFLAACLWAEVISTTGGVRFDGKGRKALRRKRASGTEVVAEVKMSRELMEATKGILHRMLPPAHIATTVNGELLTDLEEVATYADTLETEYERDGVLRRTFRKTDVRVLALRAGEEKGWLHELGVPVQVIDTPWHVDIRQRIPLSLERDAATWGYVHNVCAGLLDHCAGLLADEQAREPWVTDALTGTDNDEAVRTVIKKRHGAGAVVYDPSDPEANKVALDCGAEVVHGGTYDSYTWDRLRKASALTPAGQVYSTKLETAPDGVPPIPMAEWEPWMRSLATYIDETANFLGVPVAVELWRLRSTTIAFFQKTPVAGGAALFGVNVAHGIWSAVRGVRADGAYVVPAKEADEMLTSTVDEVVVHEIAHAFASDHLSSAFHEACTRLGAALRWSPCALA